MNTAESPVNIKAAAWTVGVHILLFLLFFMVRYSTPTVTAAEELGMEVNLGTSEDGSGDEQPMAMDDPAPANPSVAYSPASAPAPESAKAIETSDDPDAPAVATNTTPTNTPTNNLQNRTRNNTRQQATTTATQTTPAPPKPRYVYSGGTGRGGNSAATDAPGGSEGNTTGAGDRGVPGGTPGAANYTGSPGKGSGGVSHTLKGRDLNPRQFEAEFNEGGRVIIRVTVDQDGKIVSKRVKSSPNATLTKIALQKLAEAKFSASKDAAPQQFGEVTIVFKTRT